MWLLSSDGFPFQTILMEGQSTISLDGRVWALDEVPSSRRLLRLYSDSFGAMQPPLAVVQHAQTARKFVLISAHGTQIVSKLRPADHLRQLLIEHGGPDNDVIKAFFSMHTETQAAASCLVLASSQAGQDSHVAEWATRAFFLYGGEPRLFFPGMDFAAKNVTFHPHLASTPAGAVQQSPFNTPLHHHHPGAGFGGGGMPEMHFSFKHNGLYLFFSRLVRPVWLTTLVIPGNKETPLASTVDAEELDWIMAQLFDLASFLERNSAAATASSSTTLAAAQMDPQVKLDFSPLGTLLMSYINVFRFLSGGFHATPAKGDAGGSFKRAPVDAVPAAAGGAQPPGPRTLESRP
jgi:nuclear pore complex protein Nup155